MASVRQPAEDGSWSRIYRVVRRIPAGRVATYGHVAAVAGLPRQARLVGYALAGVADGSGVPWHRVINAQGRISARRDGPGASVLQRLRLEEEGVGFDTRGRVDLERYGWKPRSRQR
ncbi:MAG: MGMT family protein [Gemmatirosa sp.]|nr:MGMT family protein [Gemmatirosa sp.]